jgi:biotin-dependent carboxylase-like uncharacterized protein
VITISKAPAWLVVQDLGWVGHRAIGMPAGGAMDRQALAVGNFLVGNPAGAAGLEWALGGGTIRFERPATFALAGAAVEATIGGRSAPMHTTLRAEPQEELRVVRFRSGQFVYVTIQGGIAVDPVLGSRSTYTRGGFGGLHGRRLRAEDYLPLGPAIGGPPAGFAAPAALAPSYPDDPIRITPGPQHGLFETEELERLVGEGWLVAAASDRMGYRLKGTAIRPRVPAAHPSEPACPGAVQIPDEGHPIVLMADGPTVGGYPKIAVVCDADLGRLAQRSTGREVHFTWIEIAEGQRLHRRRAIQLHTLASLTADATES